MEHRQMSVETTNEMSDGLHFGESHSWLDRSLASLIRVTWETVAWVVIVLVGAFARFYDLGARAMSHDESLHALYSYYLYNAGNYSHDPMMHGPLLFHMNALIYFLFGDNDATARLVPALFGVGVIIMAYLFRRYIGRTAAIAVGVMVAISPSLLFHSRYIRNDIYIAFLTLVWIYGAFRYLDAAHHGVATRRFRWLGVMMLGMAFGFISKENHFMHGAILGAFFAALALWQVIQERMFLAAAPALLGGGLGFWLFEVGQTPFALIVAALGIAVSIGLLVFWLRPSSADSNNNGDVNHGANQQAWLRLRMNDAADLAVIMLTLIMPFLAPFGHLLLGWDAMAYSTTTDLLRSLGLILIMAGMSVGVAYYWFGLRPATFGRQAHADSDSDASADQATAHPAALVTFGQWAQLMGGFWLIQILFFTTFLTNTRGGLATGIVGSLGYWLAQQEVARGGQPFYYYAMLGWLYEFLPLILSLGAGVAIVYYLRRDSAWDPVAAVDLPEPAIDVEAEAAGWAGAAELLRRNRVYFIVFTLWWTVGMWLAYTVAGEKMPWLLTHMALPMCVLGGWWLGRLIIKVDWPAAGRNHGLWLLLIPAALIFAGALVIARTPFGGRTVSAVAETTQWLLALAAFGGLLYLGWWSARRVGRKTAARLAAVGFALLLGLLTVRYSFMLNYINYDLATEYLVYAHASPDVKRALNEIDLISQRTVGGRNIKVAYDDDTSWPLSWYMRQYPNSRFYGANPTTDAMDSPVIIVGPKNYEKVRPYVQRDYVKRTYRLVWWPDQGYFNLTPQRFFNTVTDPAKMRRILDIVLFRRYPAAEDPSQLRPLTEWPNRHEFEMYVRRDLAAQIWDLNVLPVAQMLDPQEELLQTRTADVAAASSIAGPMGEAPLVTPRDVAAGPDGLVAVADTGNHRIVVIDGNGEFVREFGSLCRLAEGADSGCVDPDGDGPLALGDGQFYEPWGVTMDADGRIYVADTWNGRIQVFAEDGAFLRKWGAFNTTDGELGDPMALFGPRGVAIDSGGNLLVADTGNKRILQFTSQGELVSQVGGGGRQLGNFEEPTDVIVDPRDGSIFVADAWNQRIQKLDPSLEPLAEWPVNAWGSDHLYHKPSLAVADNGDVYASDPENFRVLIFNSAGGLKAAFGTFGLEMNQFALPLGVTWEPQSSTLLVADADNQRVQRFSELP